MVSKTLKPEELVKATKHKAESLDYDYEPLDESEAFQVLSFFGYDESITDNILSSYERRIFNKLHDWGIVSLSREEAYLHSGKRWRIHYWEWKRKEIKSAIEGYENTEKQEKCDLDVDIYEDMDESIWKDHVSAPAENGKVPI